MRSEKLEDFVSANLHKKTQQLRHPKTTAIKAIMENVTVNGQMFILKWTNMYVDI